MNYTPPETIEDLLEQAKGDPIEIQIPFNLMIKQMEVFLAQYKCKKDIRLSLNYALNKFILYTDNYGHFKIDDLFPSKLKDWAEEENKFFTKSVYNKRVGGGIKTIINKVGLKHRANA